MGDNIARVVSECSIVMHILARVYKYRVNSRIRWTEEVVEDCVDNLKEDAKDGMKKVLNEAREKYDARRKQLLFKSHKEND